MNGSVGPIDVERPLEVIGGPKEEEDVITNASSYEGGVISNS